MSEERIKLKKTIYLSIYRFRHRDGQSQNEVLGDLMLESIFGQEDFFQGLATGAETLRHQGCRVFDN